MGALTSEIIRLHRVEIWGELWSSNSLSLRGYIMCIQQAVLRLAVFGLV